MPVLGFKVRYDRYSGGFTAHRRFRQGLHCLLLYRGDDPQPAAGAAAHRRRPVRERGQGPHRGRRASTPGGAGRALDGVRQRRLHPRVPTSAWTSPCRSSRRSRGAWGCVGIAALLERARGPHGRTQRPRRPRLRGDPGLWCTTCARGIGSAWGFRSSRPRSRTSPTRRTPSRSTSATSRAATCA